MALALPAAAINSYNAQPAPERTEVGAFVALWSNDEDPEPERFDWVCSGAMVDDDTYLTAAHCTDDWPAGTRFFVSLEQDFQSLLRRERVPESQRAGGDVPRGRLDRRGRPAPGRRPTRATRPTRTTSASSTSPSAT